MSCRPIALAAVCAVVLPLAATGSPAVAAACPNEAVRAEQGAAALALPDCRAYELVSPGSTPSVTTDSTLEMGGKASAAGDALAYFSRYPAESATGSSEWWKSMRSATGWIVEAVAPQETTSPASTTFCGPGVAYSQNLDASVLSAGWNLSLDVFEEPAGECGMPLEELVPGEPRGYGNLYLRSSPSAPYGLVNEPQIPTPAGNATFQDASSDLSHIVFGEEAQLTPEAPAGYNLFEWASGTLRLVGILPNGNPVPAELAAGSYHPALPPKSHGGAGTGLAPIVNAVSDDGERVFFQANGGLYLRENAGQPPGAVADCLASEPGRACTLQIDASRGLGKSGGGIFQFASADGGRVFFTSESQLTFPSGAEPGKPDLYQLDIASYELVDLTVAGGKTANVRGFSGAAADGSYVYFVARGVLTASEQNSEGETAQAGEPNLYVAHNRALTYVATLAPWNTIESDRLDRADWTEVGGLLNTHWSNSGRYLAVPSFKPLTGFDNSPAPSGDCSRFGPPCRELFLYDAVTRELRCVSCDPNGSHPIGDSGLNMRPEFLRGISGPGYLPRAVSDRGQVFFETLNPLLPTDTNAYQDVYEYDSGQLHLISSGTAEGGSTFFDRSADGGDIFFSTPQPLVRADTDRGLSIYDARAGGGFAEPELPPPACGGEDCRGSGTLPAGGAAATNGFVGPGNLHPRRCKSGRVWRHGRCVKRKRRHGHGRRKHSHTSQTWRAD